MKVKSLSHVLLFATPWTVAHQVHQFVGFSRKEYWSGLPFPPPGDLSDPEIEPESLTSPALADGLFTTSVPWEAPMIAGKVANAFLAPSPRQKARLGRPENQSSHGR